MSLTLANPMMDEAASRAKAMRAADRLARILKTLEQTPAARLLYVSQVFASSGLLSRREAGQAVGLSRGPETE
jgi:hypothetical protein